MGQKYETFDVYDYRGDKLKAKLESYLSKGNISAIVYSNPNNPSWICLKEEELRIIGELATQYDVIVLEDLAYFAMDFRQDLSKPFQAPYQPSVAHYTDYYVLLISGSKAFSYAGQRIGVSCISDKLYHRAYPGLTQRYGGGTFGTVFIHRVLYALSSGTSHSAQYALAAMLKAANEDQYNFLDEVKVYGERARRLKEIFLRHGFHLVYDNDLGDPVADGFYFTIGYPGMSSGELARELMYYGVSAISLVTTGSHQEGLRACTSFIQDHQYDQLDERMAILPRITPSNKKYPYINKVSLPVDAGIPPQSGTGIVIPTQCLYQSGILLGILRLQSAGKVQTANHCLSIYAPVFTVIKAYGE